MTVSAGAKRRARIAAVVGVILYSPPPYTAGAAPANRSANTCSTACWCVAKFGWDCITYHGDVEVDSCDCADPGCLWDAEDL